MFNIGYLLWVIFEFKEFIMFGSCKSYLTRRTSSAVEVIVLLYLAFYITMFWTWIFWLDGGLIIQPRGGSDQEYTDLWNLGVHFKSCLDLGGVLWDFL